MTSSGYFESEAQETFEDKGVKKLQDMFALSKEVTLMGRISADLFNQERLLLNNLELNIEIMPHNTDFCLMQPKENTMK